jgi:lipopolysaccharide export LptBFGC system permease protein LptF
MAQLVAHYAWVVLAIGLLGVLLGIDRTVRREQEESALLRILALFGGLVLLALPIVIVVGGEGLNRIAPFSLLVMLLLGLSLCARAMRRVPMTFLVVGAVGVGLFLVVLRLQGTELGGTAAMTVIAVVMLAILASVFVSSFVFEGVLDSFLGLLGWGPLVTVVAMAAVAQGALIAFGVTGPAGLLEYL